VPWTLYFPFATVDDRVAAREHVSILRRDPAVVNIRPTYVRGQPFVIFAEFLEGHDEPSDPGVAERLRAFLAPLPDRAEVQSVGHREGTTILESLRAIRELDGATETPPDIRDQIISEYLGSAGGRSRLAASMIAPLRQRMDYTAVGRRTFLVDQLPDGALPVYDRDITVVEPPPWAVPGAWAEYVGQTNQHLQHGDVAQIEAIVRPADVGCNGPNYVRQKLWGRETLNWNPDTEVSVFIAHWRPCNEPVEPLSVWDRLQGEDLF
jgi:hypothetical protein